MPPLSRQVGRGGWRAPSFNDLIRPQQHRRRDRQPEGLRGLEVDDQRKPRDLLDGEISGLRPLQDPVYQPRPIRPPN